MQLPVVKQHAAAAQIPLQARALQHCSSAAKCCFLPKTLALKHWLPQHKQRLKTAAETTGNAIPTSTLCNANMLLQLF
jgi:hypothetical protein